MTKDREIIILDSYKHARDTEQDRVRVGDKVVNRYGRAIANPWLVVRIFKVGARGQRRFDLERNTSEGLQTRSGLAAEYQKAGQQ